MVIGFGVGAGFNVLLRFAGAHPDRIHALISVGGTRRTCTWREWVNIIVRAACPTASVKQFI